MSKEKKYERWGRIRKNGRKNYIIKYGVILWGIPTGIIWFLGMHFLQTTNPWYIQLIIALIIFPLSGIILGSVTWSAGEKKYSDHNNPN